MPQSHTARRGQLPAWLMALVLVLGLLVFALYSDWFGLLAPQQARLYDLNRPVASITIGQQSWIPRGPALAFRTKDVRVAGRSPEGFTLYTLVGGGGGDGGTRYYVRTKDGRYQPLYPD